MLSRTTKSRVNSSYLPLHKINCRQIVLSHSTIYYRSLPPSHILLATISATSTQYCCRFPSSGAGLYQNCQRPHTKEKLAPEFSSLRTNLLNFFHSSKILSLQFRGQNLFAIVLSFPNDRIIRRSTTVSIKPRATTILFPNYYSTPPNTQSITIFS